MMIGAHMSVPRFKAFLVVLGALAFGIWEGGIIAEGRAAEAPKKVPQVTEEKGTSPLSFKSDSDFLESLQRACFDFFWHEADPQTGLIRDRSQASSPSSIAGVGFGLTAFGIGVDHGWVNRPAAAARTALILKTLEEAPQGSAASGVSGFRGWFYHFLETGTGARYRKCELSSIDTALLMAGVLYAREYFDGELSVEKEIRARAERLFARIDWKWMLNGDETLSMGWHPESGFIEARWRGYNEASILYLLGIGAKNGLEAKSWRAWTKTYEWQTNYGESFIKFPPLFGHQYSACWVDFRGIADDYTAARGFTYFENSRRATLAQRAYAITNPKGWAGYGANVWGLTACDGPSGYSAHGTPPPENDDGTIAPTAAGGSLPFTPEESVAALRYMYDQYRTKIWCRYGFRDSFNLAQDWWDEDVLGIDQGPILIMAENMRSGAVWKIMSRCEALRTGLQGAGFRPVKNSTK
jgi:hypothetical protein